MTADAVAFRLVRRVQQNGFARFDERGWRIGLSRPGYPVRDVKEWLFTAKRIDDGRPSELDMAFLRRVLAQVKGPAHALPEELTRGMFSWRWK